MNNQLIREHTHKDDCNEMQYIDPDEVRIKKLEKIVEYWYDYIKWKTPIDIRLEECFKWINVESHTEKYTPKEITNALMEWFFSEDIIEFLLTNYMENI